MSAQDRLTPARNNLSQLSGRAREIGEILIGVVEDHRFRRRPTKALRKLWLLLWPENLDYIQSFAPGSDERRALEALITPEEAHLAKTMWDCRPNYPLPPAEHTGEVGRPGHHSIVRAAPNSGLYAEAALYDLLNYVGAWLDSFDVKEHYLKSLKGEPVKNPFSVDYFLPRLYAAFINKGDGEAELFFALLRDISEDSPGFLSEELILGLLMSEKDEAIKLVLGLLDSSPLQEGFWQDMADLADLAGPKGFLALARALADRRRIRAEHLGRLFMVWTGLDKFDYFGRSQGRPILSPKAAGAYLPQALRCLTDENHRLACLDETDPMKVLPALWAAGARDIRQAAAEAGRLLNGAARAGQMAALFYIHTLPSAPLKFSLIRPLLDRPEIMADHEMAAWVINCLPWGSWRDYWTKTYYKSYDLAGQPPANPEHHGQVITLSARETVAYYLSLKKTVLGFDGPNHREVFADTVRPGLELAYSHKMADYVLLGFLGRRGAFENYQPQAALHGEMKEFNRRWNLSLDFAGRLPEEAVEDELDRLEVELDGRLTTLRDDFCAYVDRLAPEGRAQALFYFLGRGRTAAQRRAALNMLNDGHQAVRGPAWHHLFLTPVTDGEILLLEDFLGSKKKDEIRLHTVCKILFALEHRPEDLRQSIERLKNSSNKNQKSAGEEFQQLVMRRSDDPEYADICRALTQARPAPAKKTKRAAPEPEAAPAPPEPPAVSPQPEAAGEILPDEAAAPKYSGPDPAGGLFADGPPPRALALPEMPAELHLPDLFGGGPGDPGEMLARYRNLRRQIEAALNEHQDMSYEALYQELDIRVYAVSSVDRTGRKTIGEGRELYPLANPPELDGRPAAGLDRFPLAEEWKKLQEAAGLPPGFLYFMSPEQSFSLEAQSHGLYGSWGDVDPRALPGGDRLAALLEFEKSRHNNNPLEGLQKTLTLAFAGGGAEIPEPDQAKGGYEGKVNDLIAAMAEAGDFYQKHRPYLMIIQWLMRHRPVAGASSAAYGRFISHNLKWLGRLIWPLQRFSYHTRPAGVDPAAWDRSFSHYFQMVYNWNLLEADDFIELEPRSYAHACRLELLPPKDLAWMICRQGRSDTRLLGHYHGLTSPETRPEFLKIAPKLESVLNMITDAAVEVEKKRGELTTEVSELAAGFEYIAGTRHFVDLLELVDGKFDRGLNSRHLFEKTRQAMFCYLLRQTRPAPGEDGRTLGRLLRGRRISEADLISGAMYAPQWIAPVSEHLGWPGRETALWFFQAHVNSLYNPKPDDQLARFSLLRKADFEDGAFDLAWYEEALAAVGETRFNLLYDRAKYIAGGGAHRRVKMFIDARRGRLKADELLAAIEQKRSRPHLMAYGLLPLPAAGPETEALERYELFQRFKKESQKLSALKREGDGKAADLAVANLAAAMGYEDLDLFIWDMEDRRTRELMRLAAPRTVGDVELSLAVDSRGPEIIISRGGRPQKSLPAKIKKEPCVAELTEAVKDLRRQSSRARRILEQAMVEGRPFKAGDLEKLGRNPVVAPMLKNLIFKVDDTYDLPENFQGQDFDRAVIAHPHHFWEEGRWADWQRLVFDRRIVQPFKQVFREYYPRLAGETGPVIERYDNRSVSWPKGETVLKTRGWARSHDEGLRKILRREKLVATLGLLPDMNPGRGDAWGILGLMFSRRGDWAAVNVEDVPPIILSEALRDVDLLISVAGAGGPLESSAATVEMRLALASELARLLKLDQVGFEDRHAVIDGRKGRYRVHLGSGQAHKADRGALLIEAVPGSEKIFLPFVDDDPGASEVLSKILLLAEDHLIKDPAILAQIG